MSFTNISNKTRLKSLHKGLCASSATSVLLAVMAFAPAAQAQVTVDVTDCATFTDGSFANPLDNSQVNNFSNPGEGAVVNINVDGNCLISDGDNILLEDDDQDDVTINVLGSTTLTNTDGNDEEVVFFIDNGENNTTINVRADATIQGEDGVIFIEGDTTRINNLGTIRGLGTQDEGVIYIDRDTDGVDGNGDQIVIANVGEGLIQSVERGPAIGIELLLADGFDDAEDIGAQNDVTDFPSVVIVNGAGATISSIYDGTTSDDNDAINIAGNPGSTGGFDRVCIEVGAVNCIVNLRLVNSGTISSVNDNGGVAAITIEDDAVFSGAIINRDGGVISGFRNGIRIGDVVAPDGVSTAEHGDPNGAPARILNDGLITGTNTNGRGIDLEGDNVRIFNNASGEIIGGQIGIEVGNGNNNTGSSDGIEATNSGVNNFIINAGNIEGSSFSIDSNNAEGVLRIRSNGGTFTGDIRGSEGVLDALVINAGETTLTHDVLQNVAVSVSPTGSLLFDGDRTIEGTLGNRGSITFDISNTQTVTGDVFLQSTATIAITDTTGIGALGDQYTLVDVGGVLFNESTLDTSDASLLLDFQFVTSNDLVVEAVAAGGGAPSAAVSGVLADIGFQNPSANAFGETVLTAFVDGSLNNTAAFSNLAGVGTSEVLGTALTSLAPDFNGVLVQNVFNTIQSSSDQVDYRLNDLACNEFGDSRESAALGSKSLESCLTFAQSGAWIQSSNGSATQGSLSLSAPTFFSGGGDNDNLTLVYGYDQPVSDSTVLGFSGSYTQTQAADNNVAASSTELDIVQLSAYAGHRVGNAHFVTKASFSHGEADTRRQSFDVIRSEVDINAINAQSVASYNINLGQGYYLKPEAGLHYNNITTGSFVETGGLNLAVNDATTNVLDGRAGLTLGARKLIADNTRANVFVTGTVRNDIYGSRDDIGFNFSGQSGSLAVANLDEFSVQALAGVNLLSGENFSFGGAVNSEFSESENSVGASVQTRIRW